MDITNWNTGSLTDIKNMFANCSSLGEIKNYNAYRIQYKNKSNILYKIGRFVKPGTTITAEAKDFNGYVLKSDRNKSITVSNDIKNNEIIFDYARLFNVVFKNYNGEVLKKEVVEEGSKVTAPEPSVRENTPKYTYNFRGWSNNSFNNVTRDIEATALYSQAINKYDYIIIYRCQDIILDIVEGNDDYDKIINVEDKEFHGFKLKKSPVKEFVISDDEDKNIIYVEHEKCV